MSAANIPEASRLTTEQRIKILRLACAGDRLELALATRPPTASLAARLLEETNLAPLFGVLSTAIGPWLPRKLRFVMTAARAWNRVRKA